MTVPRLNVNILHRGALLCVLFLTKYSFIWIIIIILESHVTGCSFTYTCMKYMHSARKRNLSFPVSGSREAGFCRMWLEKHFRHPYSTNPFMRVCYLYSHFHQLDKLRGNFEAKIILLKKSRTCCYSTIVICICLVAQQFPFLHLCFEFYGSHIIA